jgi:hypothetical protein
LKNKNIVELISDLLAEEKIITDVLRQIILSAYPGYIREKISYHVPFYYGNKGIAIIWPASIPRGGIESGVLLGFWHGNKIMDPDNYLVHGTNKQVFYKIFQSADEIDDRAILKLLKEAVHLDRAFAKSRQ